MLHQKAVVPIKHQKHNTVHGYTETFRFFWWSYVHLFYYLNFRPELTQEVVCAHRYVAKVANILFRLGNILKLFWADLSTSSSAVSTEEVSGLFIRYNHSDHQQLMVLHESCLQCDQMVRFWYLVICHYEN